MPPLAFRRLCLLCVCMVAMFAVTRARSAGEPAALITEVAWMGSDLSPDDEWFEVGCVSDDACDVSGWFVTSMNSAGSDVIVARFATGTIVRSGSGVVIAKLDAAHSRLRDAPLIVAPALSLPNTKLKLALRDRTGVAVDIADDGNGAPLAGANPSGGIGRASMERVRFGLAGSDGAAWGTALISMGFDDGANMFGTPGLVRTEETEEHSSSSTSSSASCGSLNPQISIQSGSPTGVTKVTINVEATGVPSGGACHWDFSDGFSSDSCNPPSHTFGEIGSHRIALNAADRCGNFVSRSLNIDVTNPLSADGPSLCPPTIFPGLFIAEILPRPDDGDEWIEIVNESGMERHLCGWTLDDREAGSAPFRLDGFSIGDGESMVLARHITGLALNDDADNIRLISPDGVVVSAVPYVDAPRGKSFALRGDGAWVWTAFPTPGAANRFPIVRDAPRHLRISAVLPNPHGTDADQEWLRIANVGIRPLLLNDVLLCAGASRASFPDGAALRAGEEREWRAADLGVTLANERGELGLRDRDDQLLDALTWTHAPEGVVIRPAARTGAIIGDVIAMHDDGSLDVGMRVHARPSQPFDRVVRVTLAGIDITDAKSARPVIESLLSAGIVNIFVGADAGEAMIADIETPDGISIADALIRRGFAAAVDDDGWRSSLQADAQNSRVGLWHDWVPPVVAESVIADDEPVLFALAGEGDSPALSGDANAALSLREVLAVPNTGEEEWVEVGCDADACDASGWSVDDMDGGSRPYRIPSGTIVKREEPFLLRKSQTKLAFNDDGDDLRLMRPDGIVTDSTSFGKLPRGGSYARVDDGSWCVTTSATPGTSNVCTAASGKSVVKKIAAKKKRPKAKSAKPETAGHAEVRQLFAQILTGSTVETLGPSPAKLTWTSPLPVGLILILGGAIQAGLWWVLRRR